MDQIDLWNVLGVKNTKKLSFKMAKMRIMYIVFFVFLSWLIISLLIRNFFFVF